MTGCWIVLSQVAPVWCLMLDLQVDTELGVTSSPDVFARLRDGEREVSRIRARQVRLLREFDAAPFFFCACS